MPALPGGQILEADGSEHQRPSVVGMWTIKFYVGTTLFPSMHTEGTLKAGRFTID
jgi:hypothetical protein